MTSTVTVNKFFKFWGLVNKFILTSTVAVNKFFEFWGLVNITIFTVKVKYGIIISQIFLTFELFTKILIVRFIIMTFVTIFYQDLIVEIFWSKVKIKVCNAIVYKLFFYLFTCSYDTQKFFICRECIDSYLFINNV